MLAPNRVARLWENLLAAETRAFYFGDLATVYARRKQWITGISFFLSSAAAATIIARAPSWVPVGAAGVTAIITAYSLASGLDRKVLTMAKLSSSWREIAAAYDRLWSHTHDVDAEAQLDAIIAMERAPSELATTDAPLQEDRLDRWQQRVFALHKLHQQDA